MKNAIQIFQNPEFGQVRTLKINGEPWFVGKDVAEILGYSNPRKTIIDHVDEEDKGVTKCDTLGGTQNLTIINESGLYSLILSSKLPGAKKFKRWVTSEVLPAIRKTGGYSSDNQKPPVKSLKDVVDFAKIMIETMKAQGCNSSEIAIAVNEFASQFNVTLPECFIKPEETTLSDVYDMIDYIYQQPTGRGHKKSTYDEYIISRTTTTTIRKV